MRKRPKYKIGDILENWNMSNPAYRIETESTWNYMVISIDRDKTISGKTIYFYNLKDITHGYMVELRAEKVDMTHWGRFSRLCREGWRKVA